ncbi:Fe-only nitrogenase accessory protein AnfO [Fundidesulfovibrio butyratiphilus]
MRIATSVDDQERVASVYEVGRLLLYDNADGAWAAVREIAFAIRPDMGLAEAKASVRAAAAQLEGCSVFLSSEARGFVPAILQEDFGFHIWKSEGPLRDQLDFVAAKEAERTAAPPPPVRLEEGWGCACQGGRGGGPRLKRTRPPEETVSCPAIDRVGEGHYRIDLASALDKDPRLNSRMVLVPILEGSRFARLEIVCDHVPRWLPAAVADLNLKAEYTDTEQGVTVDVSFPPCDPATQRAKPCGGDDTDA